MPNPFVADLRLCVTFGEAIPLIHFEQRISSLLGQGIYALREGTCRSEDFDPLAPEVKYIGKAIGETVFSRCQKHLWTVTDARDRNGKPKTRPGLRFKVYRESRQFQPEGLHVFPALMADADPYLVSCAEELLLFRYAQLHGGIPAANTKP
jgi:hypothetical protein